VLRSRPLYTRLAMPRRHARQLRALPPAPFPERGQPGFIASFRHAWRGLVHTIVHQRNMRFHVTSGVLVGLVGSGIPLGLAEKVTLIFCVLLVLFAEILNSALEQLVDLAVQQFDAKARTAKDAAAAGVLVLALGTVVVFAALLVHNWAVVSVHGPAIARQVALGIPLTLCAVFLMSPRLRPAWADLGAFVVGCALLTALVVRSESYVFSAMTFGLLVLAGDAARKRRDPRHGSGQA
jgi:diacylglycerol kinase (ATP)